MTLDTFQYVLMYLTFPLAVLAITASLKLRKVQNFWVAAVLTLWFSFTAYAQVQTVGRVPGALFGILLPVLLGSGFLIWNKAVNSVLLRMSVVPIIALHVTRLAGGLFIPLAWDERLSKPFGYIAGGGDVLAALFAIPMAVIAWSGKADWAKWLLAWNVFGIADFILAIGLGIASQPNSPLQILTSSPGTAILGELPWRFIPSYFVPLYILTHVALFVRLFHQLTLERTFDQSLGIANAIERRE
jgi:hypothetical protein